MQDLVSTYGPTTWLPLPVIAARLVLATLLGAMVGLEREWRRRPAGLRTHMLVCLAACTVAILTIEITYLPTFAESTVQMDPIRLIEAVTGGVAFLAAGLIVFARGKIHGLTTGAGLWLAGAIGLACGLGLWPIAVMATALGLLVLYLLRRLENRLNPEGDAELAKDGDQTRD